MHAHTHARTDTHININAMNAAYESKIRIYMLIYIHTQGCMHSQFYTLTHSHICILINLHTQRCMHKSTGRTHASIHALHRHMQAHAHCTKTCMHTQTHACIHKPMHAHMHCTKNAHTHCTKACTHALHKVIHKRMYAYVHWTKTCRNACTQYTKTHRCMHGQTYDACISHVVIRSNTSVCLYAKWKKSIGKNVGQ